MRITAKVDYAVRAATELAAAPPGPITGETLAARQDIPGKFLENILADLRRAGIVASQRGAEGGFGDLQQVWHDGEPVPAGPPLTQESDGRPRRATLPGCPTRRPPTAATPSGSMPPTRWPRWSPSRWWPIPTSSTSTATRSAA